MSEVQSRVVNTVARVLRIGGTGTRGVTPASRFVADLGCDSLDMIELQMALEDEFGIQQLPDDESEKCVDVAAAAELVRKYMPA